MNTNQPPRGGCVNCGLAVRTRKGGAWVCGVCYRTLTAHDAGRHTAQPIANCGPCASERRAWVKSVGLA